MTAREALQLSIAHNLGSARNTLMPGVELPAYTPGADPDAWHARVQAIGLSRLAPVNTPNSAFTAVRDPVAPMWTGPGSDSQIVRRDPQAQEQVVQRLMTALRSAGGDGGGTTGNFTGSRWVFGNDIGSASAAVLGAQNAEAQRAIQWASLQAQKEQAAANRELAAAQLSDNRADRAARLAQIERAWKNTTDETERNRLQAEFENELQLLEFKAGEADAATTLRAYNAQGEATKKLGVALSSYNATAAELAAAHNAANEGNPTAQVRVDYVGGVAKFVPGANASPSAVNTLNSKLASSPAGTGFVAAQQALAESDIAIKAAPYTRTAPISLPKAPKFTSVLPPPAMSPAQAAAARSGAVALLNPGFTPAAPMRASVMSLPAPVPATAAAPVAAPFDYDQALMDYLMPESASAIAAAFANEPAAAPAVVRSLPPPTVTAAATPVAAPGRDIQTLRAEALQAISRGAAPAAVAQRFKQMTGENL